MTNQELITNTSKAYVMSKYLAELCKQIGKEAYLKSLIRLEHGLGTGFFGISNTGSADCVKERFRGITNGLGLSWKTCEKIEIESETCVGMSSARSKDIHRIEHTRELIDLFKDFEQEYIISGKPFTASDLAIWVIEHQVVCFIQKDEQKTKSYYDDNRPFTKYTKPIFYKGTNISNYTLDQLKNLNRTRFSTQIQEIKNHDFSELNVEQTTLLIENNKKHTLPPMTIAVQFHNDQFELLDRHYRYKLNKRSNPANKRWFSAEDTTKFKEWKKAHP